MTHLKFHRPALVESGDTLHVSVLKVEFRYPALCCEVWDGVLKFKNRYFLYNERAVTPICQYRLSKASTAESTTLMTDALNTNVSGV